MNDRLVIKLIKKHYSFLIKKGFVENASPDINFCKLIAFVKDKKAIVFCNDVRDRLLEVGIYTIIDGKISTHSEDITRLYELTENAKFDEIYNYDLFPLEHVISNGA
ncbi:MAG TPA: hypothetical protein PLB46_10450, partial [Chitinophagales bacterium]|nr:hypothetical protein [Chitinophagales bacterium]